MSRPGTPWRGMKLPAPPAWSALAGKNSGSLSRSLVPQGFTRVPGE